MNIEDCKPGTEVTVRGMIEEVEKRVDGRHVLVSITRGVGSTCSWYIAPEHLNVVNPDANRKFIKGDKVKLVNRGRPAPVTLEYGKTYVLEQDEHTMGGVLVGGMLISYSMIELVEHRKCYDISGCEAVRLMVEENRIMARNIEGTTDEVVKAIVDGTIKQELPDERGEPEWRWSSISDLDLQSKWRIVE